MDSNDIQKQIFDRIIASSPNPKEIKNELADLLKISKGAVYKRMNGTTTINLADLATLMRHYNFSFDDLVRPETSRISFTFPQIDRKIVSFFEYVHTFKHAVDNFAMLPDPEIYYATNEFPFFYYFLDKKLTYFKFYIYAKTVWDLESYRDRKFRISDFAEEHGVMTTLNDSLKTYFNELPNIELWNENLLKNTLNQIVYFVSTGYFELPEEAFLLCDQLEEIMHHVERMAEKGVKYMPGTEPRAEAPSFQLYYNEISHTNNMLLIKNSLQSALFTAFDNPNYIISTDTKLINYTEGWFKKILRSALPVSKDAERTRKLMFRKIHKGIDQCRAEIENILSKSQL